MAKRLVGVVLLVLLAKASSVSQAQTIDYQAAPGEPNILDQTGTALADGQTVELGYFNNGFNIQANAGNLAALGANWNLFDSTTTVTISGPGQFAGERTYTSLPDGGTSFAGHAVDLWIFYTGPGGGAPAADFHNVLAYGLFSSSVTTSNAINQFAWVFPSVGAPPPNSSPIWNTLDVKNAGVFYWGGLSGDGNSLQLEAVPSVPEPSGLALLGCGALLAGFVIRRKRQ